MSILITAGNSAQAQQLKNILAAEDVLLGDHQDIPELMIKMGKMIKTPSPRSAAFVHQMLSLCLDEQVNKLYPLRRAELLPLAEAHQLFDEFDIRLMLPSVEIIKHDIARQLTGGIVIIEQGRVLDGDILNAAVLLHDKAINGVFKVNTDNYTIFTAD